MKTPISGTGVRKDAAAGLWRWAIALALVSGLAGATAAPAEEAEENVWPREIATARGTVVLYQPQLERLEGNDLFARAAVSVIPQGESEPVFGAVWLEARISTDYDTRLVTMEEIRVPRVHFTEGKEESKQALADLLAREIPTWGVTISLDRMLAMLDVAEHQREAATGFDDSPPKILFADYPAILVLIDGQPQLQKVEGSDLQRVVNTPFLIAQEPKEKAYYLYAGSETWYRAAAVGGPWQVTTKVPKAVRKLQPEEEETEAEAEEADEGPSTPPAILVAYEATELFVTDGAPEYAPLAGGKLLYVSNSESDILVEIDTQRHFVLLSGRWFAAPSLKGPWEFVASDALPASFAEIPPDSDQGYLLTWVAGTEMANEAILDAAIPQTAAVKRDATIEVTYDGTPKFEPVEETSLQYAVNTQYQVIKAGNRYYCAHEGVWYAASSPQGPWGVASEVPEEIRKIPASSPVYNTKYVYIYDTTPEVVYVGYYPGYTYSYPYHGCLVYGTGWYYQPWYSPYHYYPRASTWGFHVRYNPWYGWSFGFSYSTGRFTFSVGTGGRYGGWWGPAGYRGYRHGYHRGWHQGYRNGARAGYRAGYRAGQGHQPRNLYNRPGNAGRVAATRPAASPGRVGGAPSTRANNVYADRNGNVMRQQSDGNWQSRQNGQWKGSDAAATTRQQQPSTTQRATGTTQRPSTTGSYGGSYGGGSLNNDAYARQRGSQRSQSYRSSAGGARRGGGARRR